MCLSLFGFGGFKLGNHLYDNPVTIASFKDLRKAISNAKRENKQLEAKYTPDTFEVKPDQTAENDTDKYHSEIGNKLLKLVAKKKQEILSTTAVHELEKQPKLHGIGDLLK